MTMIDVGDVIQLNPESVLGRKWGPLVCIVDQAEPGSLFVRCYALMPADNGGAIVPLRVEVGACALIGQARWTVP